MGSEDASRLVQKASAGDPVAVDALLQRFLPGLEAYLRGNAGAGVLAKESGADLAQSVCREVLEGLAQGRMEYRGEREFKQWLYQAALFKLQNRWRYYAAERRDARRETGDAAESDDPRVAELLASLCTPSRDAIAREDLARVSDAFRRLPAPARDVILWTRIEGLSHREVAERLGVSEAHSRVLLSRALARLATLARGAHPPEG